MLNEHKQQKEGGKLIINYQEFYNNFSRISIQDDN